MWIDRSLPTMYEKYGKNMELSTSIGNDTSSIENTYLDRIPIQFRCFRNFAVGIELDWTHNIGISN